jgi:hypothetical protein
VAANHLNGADRAEAGALLPPGRLPELGHVLGLGGDTDVILVRYVASTPRPPEDPQTSPPTLLLVPRRQLNADKDDRIGEALVDNTDPA